VPGLWRPGGASCGGEGRPGARFTRGVCTTRSAARLPSRWTHWARDDPFRPKTLPGRVRARIADAARPVTLQPAWRGGLDHRHDRPTAIGVNMPRDHQIGSRLERPGRAPTSTVSVPAELRSVEVARGAVRVGLVDSGCDSGCERDLQLATDELASILVVAADYPGQLRITVTDDDTDVSVRMQVPAFSTGVTPPVGELARLLLDAAVESYEIGLEGDQLLGVLQRALVDDNQR
jgi:hypothetical protein